jgi:UDP-glucose 4-epimerase
MSAVRPIMVTGAAGFIGLAVIEHLTNMGLRVAALDLRALETSPDVSTYAVDLCQFEQLQRIVLECQPKCVICASGSTDVQYSFEHPATDFFAQTTSLLNVLEAVRTVSPHTRVIMVSSAAVYGNPASRPISEGAPLRPISPYGYHKLAQETLVTEYRELFGVRSCIARLFSTYGPRQTRLAVWDISRRALAKDPLVLGMGDESRDYLHIAEVARAICLLATNDQSTLPCVVNVASGCETPLSRLVADVYDACDFQGVPVWSGANRLGNPTRWCADISVLRGLGFENRVNLRDGIFRTVEWIRANA